MGEYSLPLDRIVDAYDGSRERALNINRWLSWELPGFIGRSRAYVEKDLLPSFIRARKALKEIPPEDSLLVEGVIKKVNYEVRILRYYIRTGEIKGFSDKELREIRKMASAKTSLS